MAIFPKKICKTKSGQELIIRSAVIKDAKDSYQLAKLVADEEIYELVSAKEFNRSIETDTKWIQEHEIKNNHIILVAEVNSQLIGTLDFSNGNRMRLAHTGDFGMCIHPDFRSQGIGTQLLKCLIKWAKESGTIEKIGLQTHGSNDRAIGLYKKIGFNIEGVKKNHLKYDNGKYVDIVLMGLFI